MTVSLADHDGRTQRPERRRAMAPRHETRRWLSINEACRMLGVDQSTLRRWSDAGKVPVFRTPGGHRRYAEDDLLLLVDERSRRERIHGATARPALADDVTSAVPVQQVGSALNGISPRLREALAQLRNVLRQTLTPQTALSPARLLSEASIAGTAAGRAAQASGISVAEMVTALVALKPVAPAGAPADATARGALQTIESMSQALDQALIAAVQARSAASPLNEALVAAQTQEPTVLGDA